MFSKITKVYRIASDEQNLKLQDEKLKLSKHFDNVKSNFFKVFYEEIIRIQKYEINRLLSTYANMI